MSTYTQEQVNQIVEEAKVAAQKAGLKFYNEELGGQDRYSCGFAWVNIYDVKGNTKLGKMLKAAGVDQDYRRVFQIWNPSGLSCQNVDTKEVGAVAAAEVFKKYGLKASAGSRLD